jgi:putative transcriptional regulator
MSMVRRQLAWREGDFACFGIDKIVAYQQYKRVPDNTNPVLYNRIAVLRMERNLSRQALADALDINYQTVGFLERGDYNPSITLALSISIYFKLPVEAIFSLVPFRPLSEVVYGADEPLAYRKKA